MSEGRPLPAKPLAELTDAELNAELVARRARRGDVTLVAKHYASLELQEGASLDDVEKAYRRLRAKYEPFVSAADNSRSQAAQSLLDALRTAYDALVAALYSAGNTSR